MAAPANLDYIIVYANASFAPNTITLRADGRVSVDGALPHGSWRRYNPHLMTIAWSTHPHAWMDPNVAREVMYMKVKALEDVGVWQSIHCGADARYATMLVES